MKITILSPVLHDGKQLNEGDTVELDDKDARALINVGVAKAARQKAEGKLEPKQESTGSGASEQGDSAGKDSEATRSPENDATQE